MKEYSIEVPYVSENSVEVNKQKNQISLFSNEDIVLEPYSRTIIKTGVKVAIPKGFEMQIRSVLECEIAIVNVPGTIDSDYRGEIGIIATNLQNYPILINKGDRIARGVFAKVEQVIFADVNEIEPNAIYVCATNGGQLPSYETDGAAGVDISSIQNKVLKPQGYAVLKTGLKVNIPLNLVGQIRARSGLAIKKGIKVKEVFITGKDDVCVGMFNVSREDVVIEKGDRIAQIVFAPNERVYVEVNMQKVDCLDSTTRGAGGFGSTGIKAKKN